jgi:hypothetical protein
MEVTITCPRCQHSFPLTSTLAQPLIAEVRAEYEGRLQAQEERVADREAELALERRQIEQAIAERLAEARDEIREQASRNARAVMDDELRAREGELASLRELLTRKEAKLAEAQAAQADVLRRERELEDARREVALTVERRVNEAVESIRAQARREAEETQSLKLRERDLHITGLQRQIEILQQKAQTGSQQLQGEAQEVEIEAVLRAHFPHDEIHAVAKGEFGGDVLQQVCSRSGELCGSILVESKRTRSWGSTWLPKLREDQRAAHADFSILATQACPRDFQRPFQFIDGVWVVEPACLIPVIVALRQGLMAVAAAKRAGHDGATKATLLYEFVSGPQFRHRLNGLVEQFALMRQDLDHERRAMSRIWAKRSQQIERAVGSAAGLFGDVQGILGAELAAPAALELAPPSKRLLKGNGHADSR